LQNKILFVDDEELLLNGLQRSLRGMRKQWDMRFVTSAQEALEILDDQPHDAIVTDMRMPMMNGAQFLEQVMHRYPDVARIVLSGEVDQAFILKTVRSSHRHLSKPCDPELLKSTLSQILALREILNNKSIKQLISRIETLPSLPSLYLEIIEELQSPNTSFKKVGEIIGKDLGMAAKILQMVNSAFFGLCRRIANPPEAVSFLGVETVKSLVLSAKIFSQFNQSSINAFSLEDLWNHSMTTGFCAKAVAASEDLSKTEVDDSFMAGILHDLGKLVLAQNFPENYSAVISNAPENNCTEWELEYDYFGATHAEIGAYLMGLWGMQDSIVEAIAFHQCPGNFRGENKIVTAVHVANALEHSPAISELNEASVLIDMPYLSDQNLLDRLSEWQKACTKFLGKGENLDE